MKNRPFLSLVTSIILIIYSFPSASSEQFEIITELSRRSHIPVDELKELLSHCDAPMTQLNMDLCADKNFTIANLKLKKVLFNKRLQLPACKSKLDKKIVQWGESRNNACKKATEEIYKEGLALYPSKLALQMKQLR